MRGKTGIGNGLGTSRERPTLSSIWGLVGLEHPSARCLQCIPFDPANDFSLFSIRLCLLGG